MLGTVMKSTGSWYVVRTEANELVECRIKGKIRVEHTLKATNPVAVGDRVEFLMEENQNTGIISLVLDRKNYIIRRATNLSHQVQIIAANLDQALVVTSLVQPEVPLRFVDRFLVTAEAYNIPAGIILNKMDLICTPELRAAYENFREIYGSAGYQIMETSTETKGGLEAVRAGLEGKISLISGFSGVGKSSLINAIAPNLNIRTGEISDFSQKGTHTTTFAEMHELSENSYIIDTPGIKSLGLIDIQPAELSHFFPEIKARLHGCKYHNCTHFSEPKCAVRVAMANQEITQERYESYLAMLTNDHEKYY